MSLAKLTVVLKADDAIVAQSEDAELWQQLLGVIQRGEKLAVPARGGDGGGRGEDMSRRRDSDDFDSGGGADVAVQKFARSLNVSVAELEGALAPSREAPYLHLNEHNWEAFKKNVPPRGAAAISSAGLAGTMLALWIREAKLDVPATQALAAQVLGTIHQRDPNASRSINNTRWLQARAGGSFVVNPAEISRAQEVVRAFCQKRAPGDA